MPERLDAEIVRRTFVMRISRAWSVWTSHKDCNLKGSPFFNLEDIPQLKNDADYNHLLGWCMGVAAAMGWSLDEPK